jgi:glycosyltransferase involved in cell wall biosynthesis
MIKITYIIPFYNGQNTIRQCLDSVLAIDIPKNEYEIIIVDDCSPTAAALVLENYLQRYQNIRIVRHNVNKRQGGGKNTGISIARGRYVAFADQDDVIMPYESTSALNYALQNDVDMLACHYKICHENGEEREYGIAKGNKQIISGKEFCEEYFTTGYNLAPWANLYKRDYLLKINRPYEENVVMEDSDWIAWHWIHANKVGILNIPIYMWVMNPTSITHSQHFINRADWVKYGYRKIRDTQYYKAKSTIFANIMYEDGRQNIIGGMKKVWKVDNYYRFYNHLKVEDTLKKLQEINWPYIVKILIKYPNLSCVFLYPIGSFLKLINYARYKSIK